MEMKATDAAAVASGDGEENDMRPVADDGLAVLSWRCLLRRSLLAHKPSGICCCTDKQRNLPYWQNIPKNHWNAHNRLIIDWSVEVYFRISLAMSHLSKYDSWSKLSFPEYQHVRFHQHMWAYWSFMRWSRHAIHCIVTWLWMWNLKPELGKHEVL